MIRPALIFLTAVTLVCLTACESDRAEKPQKKPRFGYAGDTGTEVAPTGDTGAPSASSGPASAPDNVGPIAPPPQPPPPPPTTGQTNNGGAGATHPQSADYPYAQPVPGKPGFVVSPYAPGSGYVDVRGFAPGTEVKDPYTQKIFLVP
ncbi:MAG TPA: hypothetical protein VHY22_15655 [Chthoniobacteraceae bacterium]|jgi:hypothetical protein|nr:hypothetical protein [Chthoniobacteraceae bacterium]